MLDTSTILLHYKREDIQKEILYNAKGREIAVKFSDKGFGSRPDTLTYGKDILELAKQGASSFHASEEIWQNPLHLHSNMHKKEQDELRAGWDLVIDIDCKMLDYSKIAADLVVKALKFHDIKSISCKFSGNKGFHIGIPFEAFPNKLNETETKLLFPDAARKVAIYLKELIKKPLAEAILKYENGSLNNIINKTGLTTKEIIYHEIKDNEKIPKLDCEPFLGIDTILISSRHLYRMPYSLHEKSGLCSIPIDPNNILLFKKEIAHPKKVLISKFRFLDKANVKNEDAKKLFQQSLDFSIKKEEIMVKKERKFDEITVSVPEELFPPCIKKILAGIPDGKKRALFILVNFFRKMNWTYDKIEERLKVWNEVNPEPLRQNYLLGQIRYHKQQNKNAPPPNCANDMYYQDLRIKCSDDICKRFKNPINYSFARVNQEKNQKPKRKKKTIPKKSEN